MKKFWTFVIVFLWAIATGAESSVPVQTLSKEEATAVAALLAKEAKAVALEKVNNQENLPDASEKSEESVEADDSKDNADKQACLTVAFVDIDVAFNEHPRTIAVKEQIREKILAKENEVARAKEEIVRCTRENAQLTAQMRELKPFYERIVIEPQPLLPKIEESADTLVLSNLLNRLTFAQAEVLTASPLNTPARLEDITAHLTENKKIIFERSVFIDNYKYTTREEILQLEKQEVSEILQDIYKEIKSFAKKRNIGAIVRKDEILYGESPVNVTKDFVNRLKKSRKYRKRGK